MGPARPTRPADPPPVRASPPCGAEPYIGGWYRSCEGASKMAKVRLGQMLLDEGCINEMQLNSAIAHQGRWNTRIGEALVALGYLSERTMLVTLARQLDVPYVELGDRRVPRAVLDLVPLQ